MKVFNKPEEAAELKLGIIDAGSDGLIVINVKDIPKGVSIEDFLLLIEHKGIMIIDSDETD